MQAIVLALLLHPHKDTPGTGTSSWENAKEWGDSVMAFLNQLADPRSVISATLYSSADEDALLLVFDGSQRALFPHYIASWNEQHTSVIHWRIYDPIEVSLKPATTSFYTPHILVCVAMTPESHLEDDFNNWYNEEHILLLSRTPTWMESTRYRLVQSSDDAPTYMAMHRWGSRSALGSPEHKFATSTPWRTEVVSAVTAMRRQLYDYQSTLLYPAKD